MILSIIAAVADNGVIGADGRLPWHLPADLKHFKALTQGHPIIMGRRTFDSIGRKPLPKRINIVVTRDASYDAAGICLAHDWPQALALAEGAVQGGDVAGDEVFVIGGQGMYALALPAAARMVLTRVHGEVAGDAHFPAFDADQWKLVASEDHAADDRHVFGFTFETWVRRGGV